MANLQSDGVFPYTPPIPLLHGLRASVELLLDEGIDTVIARHARNRHRRARRRAGLGGLDMVAEHPLALFKTP